MLRGDRVEILAAHAVPAAAVEAPARGIDEAVPAVEEQQGAETGEGPRIEADACRAVAQQQSRTEGEHGSGGVAADRQR